MPLFRGWVLNLRGVMVLVFIAGYLAGLFEASVAHAEEYPTQDTMDVAGAYNYDPFKLQGAVNSTGLDALEFLYSVGEVARPLPPVTPLAPVLPSPIQAFPASGSVGWPWNLVKGCETSGRGWNANTGNGFYGGLQFDYGSWLAAGGGQYASRADFATPAQQAEIASVWLAKVGWARGWPACSLRLGLR